MTLEPVPDGATAAPIPRAPTGLAARGRRLWRDVLADYELDPQGLALLDQACRTVDRIADLDAVTARDGVMAESSQGVRVHPAIVEARQQRACLRQLVASLGLDLDEVEAEPATLVSRSAQARSAARARWGSPTPVGSA